MAVINAGWLTDFKDIKFAPKTLFSQVYVDNPEAGGITDLNSYFITFLQKLNNKDLQVNLTSNDSVKFENPGAIGVTGILDVPNGGIGLGTVTQHALLIGNGTNALTALPSAAGFLVSKQNGTAPLYSGIKGSWANLNSQTEGPTFYISFDGDAEATRYNMGKIPLANESTAGVVSTSAQTFGGGKTFAETAAFNKDVGIAGSLNVATGAEIANGLKISNGYISGILTPTANDHAANKAYVDAVQTNLNNLSNNIIGGTNTSGQTHHTRLNNLETRMTETEGDFDTLTTYLGGYTDESTKAFFILDKNNNAIAYFNEKGLTVTEVYLDGINNTYKNISLSSYFTKVDSLEVHQGTIYSILGETSVASGKNHKNRLDGHDTAIATINDLNLRVALSSDDSVKVKNVNNNIGVDGILPIVHGGTGNSLGYILTGLKSGTTSGTCATAEGKNVTASGLYSHGEGLNTSATGNYSHAQCYYSIASGNASHASGARAVASGAASFAHGQNVEARGTNSFAAGIGAFALGNTSMSLGDYSIASGFGAISIGHGISQEIQLVGPANSTEYTLSTVKKISASKKLGNWTGSSIVNQETVDTTTSYTKQYKVGDTIPQALKTQQISCTYELILSPGRTYTFHQGSSSCYGFLTKSGTSYSNRTSLSGTLTPTSPIYCLANAGSITYQWVQSGRTPIYETLTNKIIGYKVTYYRRTTHNTYISPPYATYVEAVSTALPENSYVCGDFGFAKVVSQNDAVITFDKPVFESAKTTNSPGITGLVTADGGAKGAYSIALGLNNSALNDYSVAIGCYNITKSNYQTVLGCYNLEDEANLLVVGNGSNANSRSNALILDWEGNLTLSGELLANAATASSFNEDAIIELIGHITGTASSTKDWTINTTISDNVITNGMLINSSITIAGTEVNLGESISAETLKSNLDLTDTYLPLSGGTLTGTLAGTSATFSGNVTAAKVYGAVWNDYAEYRSQKDFVEPGYCVVSKDNGQVSKTTKKYQACDGIVSDTFGFAIGETNNCQTPLAVAGRVLAYCEGDKYDYHAGDTVCAGPGGKVVKMTREEIQMWPDRIVGIVSEIPEYEIWGTGNIKVNGRIWIKIK